jgi:tRNA1(Val) A37 N6-methylase TrmN6
MRAAPASPSGMSFDAMLGGRVTLVQPIAGYRAAIDPVLLAAASPATAGQTVLDVGIGTGAATLCLLARVAGVRVEGVEIHPAYAAMALHSAALSGMADRLQVHVHDIAAPLPWPLRGAYDHVMSNPPFARGGSGTIAANPGKAAAHAEATLDLDGWLRVCLRRLRPGGSLTVIHRADRLDALLAGLHGRAGAVAVLPLWPRAGQPAGRVVVQAIKGSRAPLRLLPGLVLHDDGGGFSNTIDAILRHAAPLPLVTPL